MHELGRLPLPCDKGGECTADEVGSSKEPNTTVKLWGDGQVCELLPRADEKNQLEAKQYADNQDKEEGYDPLYWLVINTEFLSSGSNWRGNKESVFEFWRINAEILDIKKSSTLNTVKELVPTVTKWIFSTTGKIEVDLVMPETAYATLDTKTIATSKWWEDTLKLCITKLC